MSLVWEIREFTEYLKDLKKEDLSSEEWESLRVLYRMLTELAEA